MKQILCGHYYEQNFNKYEKQQIISFICISNENNCIHEVNMNC